MQQVDNTVLVYNTDHMPKSSGLKCTAPDIVVSAELLQLCATCWRSVVQRDRHESHGPVSELQNPMGLSHSPCTLSAKHMAACAPPEALWK